MKFLKTMLVLFVLAIACIFVGIYTTMGWGIVCGLLLFVGFAAKKTKSLLLFSLAGLAVPGSVAFLMDVFHWNLLGVHTLLATPLILGINNVTFSGMILLSWVFVGMFYLFYAPSVLKENRPAVFKSLCYAYFSLILIALACLLFFNCVYDVSVFFQSTIIEEKIIEFGPVFALTGSIPGFIAALLVGWGVDFGLKYLFVRHHFNRNFPVFSTLLTAQIKTFLLITVPWIVFVACQMNNKMDVLYIIDFHVQGVIY